MAYYDRYRGSRRARRNRIKIILLVLLLLFFLLLLIFIVFLFFFLVFLVVAVTVLLLRLVFHLFHAESEVVASLVILWIITKRLLICFHRLLEELFLLADDTDVMVCLSASERFALQLCTILEALYGK